MIKYIFAAIMAVLVGLTPAIAKEPDMEQVGPPLMPEDVLIVSAERFPEILESLAKQNAASGDVLAADGAFDLVFSADGFSRVTGFWSGTIANTEARQNLRRFGASVYGGYRISDGTFPVYEDINFTNTGGEFKIGAIFSLLRDREIDARRFSVADTRLAEQQARLDVMLTKVGVQQRALNAYWRWVGAGRELAVYRDLLAIAEAREAGLEEQVRRGALAKIAVIENLQNITRRRILVTQAEQTFSVAANALSFFYRGLDGDPKVPGPERLPGDLSFDPLTPDVALQPISIDTVLGDRPELARLQAAVERARNSIVLGENDLKPRLDLSLEVSRDVGNVAEGGISRDSTDTIIGFKFSVPFQQREARGRMQRGRAELRAAQLRARRMQDQIEIEVRNILINLAASLDLVVLARADVEQSSIMVEAERQRFLNGASDFFLVNVREEAAADAEIRYIRADMNGRIARTNFDAATVNTAALCLADGQNEPTPC